MHSKSFSAHCVIPAASRVVGLLALAALAGIAFAAEPIGTLESNHAVEIRAAGTDDFIRIDESRVTLYAGDAVRTPRGAAAVELASGGGLGLLQGAAAVVDVTADGAVDADVLDGTLLYALPESAKGLVLHVGRFTLSTRPLRAERIDVSTGNGFVGAVEHLGEGKVKATVRHGVLDIVDGDATHYRLTAGESLGLLDMPAAPVLTQSAANLNLTPRIDIQSPERVNTGENFRVQWQAPEPEAGDYIVISEEGAPIDEFESVVSVDEGNVLEFEAPSTAGDYEIRYLDGETGEIRQFVYLDVYGEPVAAYWWDDRTVGIILGVTAGAVAISIIDDSSDPDPVSP